MDVRKVKDLLGKSKINMSRGEYVQGLQFLQQALREVASTSTGLPPTDIRSLIREVVQLCASANVIKNALKAPLIYNPGSEKALYGTIKKVYGVLANVSETEKYEDAYNRKKKLDKYLILGKRYLQEGNIQEADQMFQGALGCYKDEKVLFVYIAKMYEEKNQIPRALSILQKAMEVDPKNEEAKDLMRQLVAKRSGA